MSNGFLGDSEKERPGIWSWSIEFGGILIF